MRALHDAADETGHVVVGGHVAIGVLNVAPPSVATVVRRLDNDAIACGVNRRADRRPPIDTRVHARIMKNWMIAHPERRGHVALGDRLSHPELAHPAPLVFLETDPV